MWKKHLGKFVNGIIAQYQNKYIIVVFPYIEEYDINYTNHRIFLIEYFLCKYINL